MITSEYQELLQKQFVTKLRTAGIPYAVSRAEDKPLPYLKLWELNSWAYPLKNINENYVRFTWWLWNYDNSSKESLEMLSKVEQIVSEIYEENDYIVAIEREKGALRDAQKPDVKCTVLVYKFKIYG